MTYISEQRSQLTSFKEQLSASPQAFIEGSADYNFVPSNFREFTANNGTTGAENRLLKVSTGTTSGGYGVMQSFRPLPHKVGKAVSTRFSGYFESNVATSWQGMGMISIGDELSFGYNGTTFGVWHRYGGLAEVRTITVTGGAGADTDLTLTLNSVGYTIPLTTGTAAHNAYEITAWLNDSANQTVWGADNVGDTVIINALSDGTKSGTYTFSHATATGSIAQNTAGVTKTSNHIAQSSWNGSVFSDFDPSKGNLYQITYQNQGWGCVEYSIMNPVTGTYDLVHRLQYPNSSTTVGLPNAALRCGFYAVSLGSTTDLSVYVNSMEASVDGGEARTRNPRSADATSNLTSTTETAVLTLRNRRTFNGYNNQVEIDPLKISINNETGRGAIVRVRSAVNTGIEQNFASAGNNLVADISTTNVAYSGGLLLDSKAVPPTGNTTIDLANLGIAQPPSLNIVVTIQRTATGGASTNFDTTITWYEDV